MIEFLLIVILITGVYVSISGYNNENYYNCIVGGFLIGLALAFIVAINTYK